MVSQNAMYGMKVLRRQILFVILVGNFTSVWSHLKDKDTYIVKLSPTYGGNCTMRPGGTTVPTTEKDVRTCVSKCFFNEPECTGVNWEDTEKKCENIDNNGNVEDLVERESKIT